MVLTLTKFSDYHRGRSSSIGVLCGAWHGVEPVTNPGIYTDVGILEDNQNGSRLSKN